MRKNTVFAEENNCAAKNLKTEETVHRDYLVTKSPVIFLSSTSTSSAVKSLSSGAESTATGLGFSWISTFLISASKSGIPTVN